MGLSDQLIIIYLLFVQENEVYMENYMDSPQLT